MPQWQYCTIDLNDPSSADCVHALNAAGKDGWELVGVTRNNIAYLKRSIETPRQARDALPSARSSRRRNVHPSE